MRISAIDRTLARNTTTTTPPAWNAELVKERLIEAFEIDRRLPDRVGPTPIKGWLFDTVDTFADRVAQGELASERVMDEWERGNVSAAEVSRMEEAFAWPRRYLTNGHAVDAKCLLAAALCIARGRSIGHVLRERGLDRAAFHRRVEAGASAIADALNRGGAPVR